MAKRRSGGKPKVDLIISDYFRELARRRNAGRTKEEMLDRYRANGLEKYQFGKREPGVFECGHPRSPENEYWVDANHAVCRQCKSVESLAAAAEKPAPAKVPELSLAERQENLRRWEEQNQWADELHRQEEIDRIRQSSSHARSVQPKRVWGIALKDKTR